MQRRRCGLYSLSAVNGAADDATPVMGHGDVNPKHRAQPEAPTAGGWGAYRGYRLF
jgi:hypothetical protein